jgi:hypothetical protein
MTDRAGARDKIDRVLAEAVAAHEVPGVVALRRAITASSTRAPSANAISPLVRR